MNMKESVSNDIQVYWQQKYRRLIGFYYSFSKTHPICLPHMLTKVSTLIRPMINLLKYRASSTKSTAVIPPSSNTIPIKADIPKYQFKQSSEPENHNLIQVTDTKDIICYEQIRLEATQQNQTQCFEKSKIFQFSNTIQTKNNFWYEKMKSEVRQDQNPMENHSITDFYSQIKRKIRDLFSSQNSKTKIHPQTKKYNFSTKKPLIRERVKSEIIQMIRNRNTNGIINFMINNQDLNRLYLEEKLSLFKDLVKYEYQQRQKPQLAFVCLVLLSRLLAEISEFRINRMNGINKKYREKGERVKNQDFLLSDQNLFRQFIQLMDELLIKTSFLNNNDILESLLRKYIKTNPLMVRLQKQVKNFIEIDEPCQQKQAAMIKKISQRIDQLLLIASHGEITYKNIQELFFIISVQKTHLNQANLSEKIKMIHRLCVMLNRLNKLEYPNPIKDSENLIKNVFLAFLQQKKNPSGKHN